MKPERLNPKTLKPLLVEAWPFDKPLAVIPVSTPEAVAIWSA